MHGVAGDFGSVCGGRAFDDDFFEGNDVVVDEVASCEEDVCFIRGRALFCDELFEYGYCFWYVCSDFDHVMFVLVNFACYLLSVDDACAVLFK